MISLKFLTLVLRPMGRRASDRMTVAAVSNTIKSFSANHSRAPHWGAELSVT